MKIQITSDFAEAADLGRLGLAVRFIYGVNLGQFMTPGQIITPAVLADMNKNSLTALNLEEDKF